MDTMTISNSLDVRGKTISTFVVYEAADRLRHLGTGEVLELRTDDFGPLRADITTWCRTAGHELLGTEESPGELRFRIEKGAARAGGGRLAMVVSVDGLEELLSPLSFALAGAMEGMEVSLYLQGPAVRVLAAGFRARLRGWARPFSRFAAAGMARAGHIAAQDKLRQLHALGARLYVCGPSLEHFKVNAADLILPDLPQVEYLTFMAVMQDADVSLYV